MTIKRPTLRYHGGKFRLAPWIISHFPSHYTYVEPFGGAASVLLLKPRSRGEVYNDVWDTVVNVFRVLRDPSQAQELARRLALTPYARTEFEETAEPDIKSEEDPIGRARLTILRSFAGFGSAATNNQHATGFRNNVRRGGHCVAMAWANYPPHVQLFTERLQGVVIENRDYRDILAMQDNPDTLFFLDPPYVHSTRNMRRGNASYAHEFTEADHKEMTGLIRKLKGTVILSGYESDLYGELLGDWPMVRRAARADGGGQRVECLWSNKPFIHKLF